LIGLKDDRQLEQNGALQADQSVNYFVNQFTLDLMPNTDRADLERSWAATAKHLTAARDQLPEVPAPGAEGASLSGFEECLRHNEMELALDELEDLGLTNAPPAEFWRRLMYAAENMELTDRAADYKRRMERA